MTYDYILIVLDSLKDVHIQLHLFASSLTRVIFRRQSERYVDFLL